MRAAGILLTALLFLFWSHIECRVLLNEAQELRSDRFNGGLKEGDDGDLDDLVDYKSLVGDAKLLDVSGKSIESWEEVEIVEEDVASESADIEMMPVTIIRHIPVTGHRRRGGHHRNKLNKRMGDAEMRHHGIGKNHNLGRRGMLRNDIEDNLLGHRPHAHRHSHYDVIHSDGEFYKHKERYGQHKHRESNNHNIDPIGMVYQSVSRFLSNL